MAGNGCICGAAFAWETKRPSAIVGCALLGDEAGEDARVGDDRKSNAVESIEKDIVMLLLEPMMEEM